MLRRYNLHVHPAVCSSRQHGLLSNEPSWDEGPLFSTCKHLRCELALSYCVHGMGSHFVGSAAFPLLLQRICPFGRGGWESIL